METRRDFILKMTGATAGLMLPVSLLKGCSSESDSLGYVLPKRKLGKTGEKVTMLGTGGYHVGWTSEKDAREVIEASIEGGIRFFDTAHNYGKGESETRYGKYLIPNYRDHIFLMTKSQALDGESLLKEFELSLSRLKTDHVDLLQLHSFRSPEDVDSRIEKGVMKAIHSIKSSGKARYIGFTGHQNPYAHLRMMEQFDDYPEFSTLQMPLNVVDYNSEHSFVRKTLPLAIENELGILAMKTLADGRFFDRKLQVDNLKWETDKPVVPDHVSMKEALYFSWSLPISVLITGAENKEMLLEKIKLAKDFVKISEEERTAILENASRAPHAEEVEYYKRV